MTKYLIIFNKTNFMAKSFFEVPYTRQLKNEVKIRFQTFAGRTLGRRSQTIPKTAFYRINDKSQSSSNSLIFIGLSCSSFGCVFGYS
jgi:hypothetical protein